MKDSPCHNCPHRKPTCHDFCREYIEWHEERVTESKARAFDKLMAMIADEIVWRNSIDRRNTKR